MFDFEAGLSKFECGRSYPEGQFAHITLTGQAQHKEKDAGVAQALAQNPATPVVPTRS